MKENKKMYTFRLHEDLMNKASKLAKEQGRSLTGHIEYLIRQSVRENEPSPFNITLDLGQPITNASEPAHKERQQRGLPGGKLPPLTDIRLNLKP